MNVRKFIEELSKYPLDMPVTITDGCKGICYDGDYAVQQFDFDGDSVLDIGVGHTRVNEELAELAELAEEIENDYNL